MRKLSFKTDAFPTASEGALDYCDGLPGSAAVRWVRDVVEAGGIPCKEPFQEEYGWGFWLNSSCMIWVGVAHTGGEFGSAGHPPEWAVSVAHEHPVIAPLQLLKGPLCRPLVEKVVAVIEHAVSTDPNISLHT